MNRKEIINLLGIATANFPAMQEKNMKPTAMLWEKTLQDLDYNLAEQALFEVISTSKFFPTVSEIRDKVFKLNNPQVLEATEAWEVISEAVRKYGFSKRTEAMRTLPGELVEMVKRFTWQELCFSERPDILRTQFITAWNKQMETKKANSLPRTITHEGLNERKPITFLF